MRVTNNNANTHSLNWKEEAPGLWEYVGNTKNLPIDDDTVAKIEKAVEALDERSARLVLYAIRSAILHNNTPRDLNQLAAFIVGKSAKSK